MNKIDSDLDKFNDVFKNGHQHISFGIENILVKLLKEMQAIQ